MSLPLFFRDTRAAYVAPLIASGRFSPHVIASSVFEQGEPNFVVPGLHTDVTARYVVYVADWSTPQARYYDLCALMPLAELQPTMLTIVIPFDPSATMERETEPGVVVTANVNAKLLSALPCASKRIVTIDLHTMANQFYFHHAAVRLASMMPYARAYFESIIPDMKVCFPDEGAKKRFGQFFDKKRTIVCAKERGVGDERRVRIVEGAHLLTGVQVDNDVVIVDDLTRTGGTLAECARALRAARATRVFVYVTHALLTRERWEQFAKVSGKYYNLVDAFYVSDTALGFDDVRLQPKKDVDLNNIVGDDDYVDVRMNTIPSTQLLLDELAAELHASAKW